MNKKYKILIILAIFLIGSWSAMYFFGQDKRTAEEFANKFYSYPLPPKTKVTDQGFDYGVGYGGGPSGSGGYPTVAVYRMLSSELSEKEVVDHYKERGFEIYFEGDEEIKKTSDGKRFWYEGKTPVNPSTKDNAQEPIEFIIQSRTEFTSAFGDLARY